MDNKMLSEALISLLGAGYVRLGELMKTHTTFRIGGAADYYVTPQAEKQIADVIAFLKKSDIKYIVIGNGSNILVSDEGFRGVVVELGDGFSDYEFLQDSQDNSDEVLVKASAGMKLTRLGNQLAANGIAGFEFATGIPGCIGGAVRMNAGAYGGEFKDILVSAKVIDDEGVNYYIGDNGPSIISVMNNEYSKKLVKRCEWVANKFGSYSEDELRNIFFNESIVVGSDTSNLNYLGE